MGGIKIFIKFVMLILLWVPRAYADDYTYFLLFPDFEVVMENGRPKVLEGNTDEKYLVRDKAGRLYKLRMKNALPTYAEVGFAIISDAIGLPSLPVFPVIIKRGEQGIPTSDEAKKLVRGDSLQATKMGLSGKNGGYFPASLQPMVTLDRGKHSLNTNQGKHSLNTNQGKHSLNTNQLAELTGQLLLNYVLGNHDQPWLNNGQYGNLERVGPEGHIVTLDATQSFKFYSETQGKPGLLGDFLKHIPDEILKSLKESEMKEYLEALNVYLTRLENLNHVAIESVFGGYFRSMNALRASEEKKPFDYTGELMRRNQSLRTEFIQWLGTKGVKSGKPHVIQEPLKIPPPHIRVPDTKFLEGGKASLAQHNPTELLWGLYFQDFWRFAESALKDWATELGCNQNDVLSKLREKAPETRGPIYWVGPHLKPEWDKGEPAPSQTHLNPDNATTLMVVPLNDREAVEIAKISKEAGAHVMELNGETYKHGSKLTPELAQEIVKKAKLLGVKKVYVVELPYLDSEVETLFEKEGLKFEPIDHHTYVEVDRWKPLSSLVQAAGRLGYKLSPSSFAVGVEDGSYIPGLRDWGITREDAIKRFGEGEKVADQEEHSTSRGPLYVLKGGAGKIGQIASGYTMKHDPVVPSVLVADGNTIRFSGDASFERDLTEMGKKYQTRVGSHFQGGDKARSRFWGMKGIPDELMFEVLAEVKALIKKWTEAKVEVSLARTLTNAGGTMHDVAEILSWDNRVRVDAISKIPAEELKSQPVSAASAGLGDKCEAYQNL